MSSSFTQFVIGQLFSGFFLAGFGLVTLRWPFKMAHLIIAYLSDRIDMLQLSVLNCNQTVLSSIMLLHAHFPSLFRFVLSPVHISKILAFHSKYWKLQLNFSIGLAFYLHKLINDTSFNSPGTIVHSVDIFPFWAKMKSFITASCNWFLQKLSLPKSSSWTIVLWKMFIFLISFITFLNLSKVKAKYEKGKISVSGS